MIVENKKGVGHMICNDALLQTKLLTSKHSHLRTTRCNPILSRGFEEAFRYFASQTLSAGLSCTQCSQHSSLGSQLRWSIRDIGVC